MSGGPLLSAPVLPTYPMPVRSSAADSSSRSQQQQQQQQQQVLQQQEEAEQALCELQSQLSLQRVVPLSGASSWGPNPPATRLLIKCATHLPAQQQQQQQQQQQEEISTAAASGGIVLPTGLLVSQQTTAEEVEAGG